MGYARYRFPPEIIDQAIWRYLRFALSLRDVEDLLAERGVAVSYEITSDRLVTRTLASRIRLTGKMAHDHLVCPPSVPACDHPARRLAV
jgi:hypothetical protein